jgi:hypothetical protein
VVSLNKLYSSRLIVSSSLIVLKASATDLLKTCSVD